MEASSRKPDWLKMKLPGGEGYRAVRRALDDGGLHTVCESARCPNLGECWAAGTATFLILGDECTRGCAFCAVARGDPGGRVDPEEPARVAEAVRTMGLRYAVVTSVTRDDLPDGGASVYAATIRAIRTLSPPPLVEVLVPDYRGEDLRTVLEARPDVLAHNVEVVERLTPRLRHGRFSYGRSLETLAGARAAGEPGLLVKSSILLGLGETEAEIEAVLRDLRAAGVDLLVLGQYLRPTTRHAEVVEYVRPERFEALAARGRELGFGFVASGPLVRTSYRAAEAYVLHRAGAAEAAACADAGASTGPAREPAGSRPGIAGSGPGPAAGAAPEAETGPDATARDEVELRVLPGLTDYDEALDLQRDLAERRRAGEVGDVLILLEHPPVITLGRHADPAGVLAADGLLASLGIPVRRIERGGQATYHGPGQIVGYPILDLRARRMGVGHYVRGLEEVLIRAARRLGVEAARREGIVGVFATGGKIGAIGVRVARGVSYHGFAFNVDPDLEHFRLIVPCGRSDLPVSSLARERGSSPGLDPAREALEEAFEEVFGARLAPPGEVGNPRRPA